MSNPRTRNIIWTQARVAEVVAQFVRSQAVGDEADFALAQAARLATDYATRDDVRAKLVELGLYAKPEKAALTDVDEEALALVVNYMTDLIPTQPARAGLLIRKMRASLDALTRVIKDSSVGGRPVGTPADEPAPTQAPALDLGEPPVLVQA